MLDRVTLEKKLGIDSSQKKYQGLIIVTISFFVVFMGIILFMLGLGFVGRIFIFLGFTGSFIGIIRHFWIMFSEKQKKETT